MVVYACQQTLWQPIDFVTRQLRQTAKISNVFLSLWQEMVSNLAAQKPVDVNLWHTFEMESFLHSLIRWKYYNTTTFKVLASHWRRTNSLCNSEFRNVHMHIFIVLIMNIYTLHCTKIQNLWERVSDEGDLLETPTNTDQYFALFSLLKEQKISTVIMDLLDAAIWQATLIETA